MNRLAILAGLFLLVPMSAQAEIRSTIVDSVQLTVDGPAIQSTRLGATYSVSGSNITATTLGGLNNSATSRQLPAPPSRVEITDGTYAVTNSGQAFTFSESARTADIAVTDQTNLSTNGRVDAPNLYGQSVQTQGGSAGSLAGTLSGTGVPTVTAGGPGTTAVGQRSVELSVFN